MASGARTTVTKATARKVTDNSVIRSESLNKLIAVGGL